MPLMNRLLTALLLSLAACAAPSGAQGGSSVEAPQGGESLGVELSSLFVGDTELLFDADTGRKRVKYFVKPPIMPLLTNS